MAAAAQDIAQAPVRGLELVRGVESRTSAHDGSRLRRKRLALLGIKRSSTSDAPIFILAALLALAGGAATLGALTGKLTADSAVALAAVVVTVAGLLVALLQWRNGLAEKAFDALYERIRVANDMRLRAFEGFDTASETEVEADRPELYRFFVYTEIDSLEFAVRRYQFGLGLNADIVERAVNHFRHRCRSQTFRDVARACSETGAYFDETKDVVAQILREARET